MDGTITIGAKIETKQFDRQIEEMERKISKIEKDIQTGLKNGLTMDSAPMRRMTLELEKSKNQLAGLYQQKEKLDSSGGGQGFGNLANGLRNAVHEAGRLALAVFGVRSAYMTLRRASSDLASYDAQYSANLEYIRYALTQMIAPVLEYIVGLAKTVLAYINYIANAWFGVNLFARASADNFKKVKQGIGGASAEAKKLQKTLTGFDEMNILNSSSTGGGGGVGGGGIGPDFDLSNLEDIEYPEWLIKLGQKKDEIIKAIKGIATAFLLFKTLKLTGVLDLIGKGLAELGKRAISAFQALTSGLGAVKTAIVAVGLFAFITGTITAIINLIEVIKDPSWENFRKLIGSIGTAMVGLGAIMVAINASNPIGWIILGIGAVASLVAGISGLIQKEEDERTAEQRLTDAVNRLIDARQKLKKVTNEYVNAVDNAEEKERALKKAEDDAGITADQLLTKMRNQNLTYKDLDESERKVYKAYLDNNEAQEKLTATTATLNYTMFENDDAFYNTIKNLKDASKNSEDYRDKVIDMYSKGKLSAQDASRAISIAMADMDASARDTFTQNIPSEIRNSLDPSNYQSEADKFKSWWNTGIFSKLKTKLTLQISANTGGKITGFKTGGLVKLASGGVVNMPNRGVPVASAIAGEAGREGIIPLTDSGAMQELGKEIGKWITINANITNNMNGRVISRELKTVQNDTNFAYNA